MAIFDQFAGQEVRVMEGNRPLFLYVLRKDDLDPDMMEELLGDLHPDMELEEGWEVVAIEGEVIEGEADAGGFLAFNEAEDRVYLCDEGSIRFLDTPASELTIHQGH